MSVKIETLQIRNFKRVTMAEVEFSEDGLTILGGANMQGKSTFLDAIGWLLGGGKYAPTNPHNLNAGGATAVLRTKLSNGIEVERSGKSSSLKVVVDGLKGNQKTLNEFLNEFALDISKFMRATAKEKAAMLLQHLGLGEKLEALDKKIKANFDERTVVNREVARKQQLAEGLPTYENAPSERVDLNELLEELRIQQTENGLHDQNKRELEMMLTDGQKLAEEIRELEAKLESRNEALAKLRVQYSELHEETEKFEPYDTAPIREKIDNAESLNMMFEANQKAEAAKLEAAEVAKEAQTLTDTINEAREQRENLLNEIEMPLDGLKVENEELYYRGQKWDCMSGAERLKVATAVSRAFKPDCGFVLVDELEQMDWKTIQEFDAWAKGEGVQIIGAMVCDEDKAGENVIIIEDGRVKA